MAKFLILGGGQQGCVVADQLTKLPSASVTLADFNKNLAFENKSIKVQYFDAKDVNKSYRNILGKWLSSFDVVVGCLPSNLGADCVGLAAEYGANYVDLSFTSEDLFQYDTLAKHNQCTIIPDCGLAPGLPNLIVGNLLTDLDKGEKLDPLEIYVGGISEDPSHPMGYIETWSAEDLYEEYTRLARYVKNGSTLTISPASSDALKAIELHSLKLEGFLSDGLRTLLKFDKVIPDMREYTLRYPGHMAFVQSLLNKHPDKSSFVKEFRKTLTPGNDVVILKVKCGTRNSELFVKGEKNGISAMTKSTAYTCVTMAEFLSDNLDQIKYGNAPLNGGLSYGVASLELIGKCQDHFSWISENLVKRGIMIYTKNLKV